MKVCGISAHFHDAAAALVVDGEIVAAAQEERFTRIKGDPALPQHAFEFCLAQGGLAPDALDAVVFYEKPFRKFYRIVASSLANAPHGFAAFRGALHAWFEKKLWIKSDMARVFAVDPARIAFSDHHLSHAAAAFLTHPVDSAATLVLDGVGEWTSTTIGRVARSPSGLDYEVLGSVDFPHSLGLLYSALTAFLGFRVNHGEYKVMGLAAFGEPRFEAELGQLVRRTKSGLFELDLSYFAHDRSVEKGWSRKLERLLGPPVSPHTTLTPEMGDEFQRACDLACSLQRLLERELLALAQRARELSGERVLCYGGGVALNSVANGKLARAGIFDDVLLHPACGDAGGALGAALAYSACHAPARASSAAAPQPFRPYLGPELVADASGDRRASSTHDAEAFAERVAEALVDDRVVGWAHGRAEWGPRALGARSILARPDRPGQRDRLNRLIKEREGFRPFAPVVLEAHADELFDGFSPGRRLERHMLGTVRTRPAWRERLDAVTHVDGSARVQVLREEDAPLLHRVLERFHARTGIPALVNTSFNHASEPIVNDFDDALRTFERCRLDLLAAYPWIMTHEETAAQPCATD